jgi:hypothetical protein
VHASSGAGDLTQTLSDVAQVVTGQSRRPRRDSTDGRAAYCHWLRVLVGPLMDSVQWIVDSV